MSRLKLSLLGPFEVSLDGEPITGFESSKVRALLAYLTVEAATPHPRGTLAGMLWPDWPEPSARKNLSNALSNLRSVIGDRDASPRHLLATRETIQFNPASDYALDVETFADIAQLSTDACSTSRLEAAVALYRGAFLEGFSVADSSAFEDWALLVRHRLDQQALAVLDWLAADHARQGRYEQACTYARRQVELEPTEEGAHARLMRLYAWSGQRAAALRQYQECARTLGEELGVPPARETTDLYERIAQDRERPPPARPPTQEPAPAASPARHNLPAQLVPLVGRSTELDEIVAQLREPACRLLTLVGPGGSGKTRLAIEAGRRILALADSGFADGVHFVPLAPLRSPQEMPSTIAEAIGLSGAEETGSREQLLGYLRDRNVLLILDNLEHLLSAAVEGAARGKGEAGSVPGSSATADAASLVAEVLHAAPQVRVLATSQARLNVRGERLYPVPGMRVPPPRSVPGSEAGDEQEYSAVQLFLQSAREVQPGFQPDVEDLAQMADICRLVGGMPLAILLAAAWMRVLSPGEITAEISGRLGGGLDLLVTDWHGVPERQRSIRAVFDHSYDLLSGAQREVLEQLCVFHGSFGREAAAEVAGATLRDLLALLDASLLQRTANGRYELHQLLRQYAAERLARSPQQAEAARDRHAAHYAAAMERWAKEVQGPGARVALDELSAEMANVRAAWTWMVERGQTKWLARALDSVHWVFESLRRVDDAIAMYACAEQWLASAAETTPASASQLRVLSRVLAGYAYVLFWTGLDRPGARDRVQSSLDLLDRPELIDQDLRRERAFASMIRGMTGEDLTCPQVADLCQSSVALYRALGDCFWAAYALNRWGYTAGRCGDWEEARRRHENADAIFRELGLDVMRTSTLFFLSVAAMGLGKFVEAERLARQNIAIRQELSSEDAGVGCTFLGWALLYLGRFAEARSAIGKGIATLGQLGKVRQAIRGTTLWIASGVHLGQYAEAKQRCRAHVQECRRLGEAAATAEALAILSWIEFVTGSRDDAWQLAQDALALAPNWRLQPSINWPLVPSALGWATRGLGRPEEGHPFVRQALRAAAGTRFVPHVLRTLPSAALLLADQGQPERAVELYALCRCYPFIANSRLFEDVVGKHIATAAEALPESVVAAGEERGNSADLWATVGALLAEWEPQENAEP